MKIYMYGENDGEQSHLQCLQHILRCMGGNFFTTKRNVVARHEYQIPYPVASNNKVSKLPIEDQDHRHYQL